MTAFSSLEDMRFYACDIIISVRCASHHAVMQSCIILTPKAFRRVLNTAHAWVITSYIHVTILTPSKDKADLQATASLLDILWDHKFIFEDQFSRLLEQLEHFWNAPLNNGLMIVLCPCLHKELVYSTLSLTYQSMMDDCVRDPLYFVSCWGVICVHEISDWWIITLPSSGVKNLKKDVDDMVRGTAKRQERQEHNLTRKGYP